MKKYWTHILNIFYFLYLFIFGFAMEKIADINLYSVLLIIVLIITVTAIWFEMVYYIVIAALNKEDSNHVLHAVLCYLLNIFYIPYYKLKYVEKDKDYKAKNIIYLQFYVLILITVIIRIIMIKYVY